MFFYFDVKAYSVCIWGSSYVIKKIDILILDGKNSLKLPGDHIDFNLNLKSILSPLLDAQKNTFTKKVVIETSDLLVSFVPSDTKYRGTRE